MKLWQTQEAKAKFSELVKMAAQTPQFVTLHGKPTVVILSQEEYTRLKKSKPSFLKFMQASPLGDTELEIHRDRSMPREIEL
jgi:prevent-host-death family protein